MVAEERRPPRHAPRTGGDGSSCSSTAGQASRQIQARLDRNHRACEGCGECCVSRVRVISGSPVRMPPKPTFSALRHQCRSRVACGSSYLRGSALLRASWHRLLLASLCSSLQVAVAVAVAKAACVLALAAGPENCTFGAGLAHCSCSAMLGTAACGRPQGLFEVWCWTAEGSWRTGRRPMVGSAAMCQVASDEAEAGRQTLPGMGCRSWAQPRPFHPGTNWPVACLDHISLSAPDHPGPRGLPGWPGIWVRPPPRVRRSGQGGTAGRASYIAFECLRARLKRGVRDRCSSCV